jgi:hypothetical protein
MGVLVVVGDGDGLGVAVGRVGVGVEIGQGVLLLPVGAGEGVSVGIGVLVGDDGGGRTVGWAASGVGPQPASSSKPSAAPIHSSTHDLAACV